jgi:serine/threonine protein phosphatase PrpC
MTTKGKVLNKNEDNFYFNGAFMKKDSITSPLCFSTITSAQQFIFAVCDGMGGEQFGEQAAFFAVQALDEFYKSSFPTSTSLSELKESIDKHIKIANKLIYEQALSLGKRMGTTLTSIVFCGNKTMTLNIGDSRVYLLRGSKLTELTTDHTEAQRLIRLGVLNSHTARFHKSKNILTRYLGTDPSLGTMEADYSDELNVLTGDTYLVCSDGLSDFINNEEIKFHLAINDTSTTICKDLIDLALGNLGTDNITACVIKILDIV